MWIADVEGGPTELVCTTTEALLEAPNWTPGEHALLLEATDSCGGSTFTRGAHAGAAGRPAAAQHVSFPAGTLGHPADLGVEGRLVRTSNWSDPITRYPLFGGQGTMNVNSWSADSRRFAFVAYPIDADQLASATAS